MLEKIILKLISLQTVSAQGIPMDVGGGTFDPSSGGSFTFPGGGTFKSPGGGTFRSPGGGIEFVNPLGVYNFQELVDRVINGLLLLATPLVVIMVMWGAFFIITSGGNPGRLNEGKQTILWTAVGYGILLIARGISFIVAQLLYGS